MNDIKCILSNPPDSVYTLSPVSPDIRIALPVHLVHPHGVGKVFSLGAVPMPMKNSTPDGKRIAQFSTTFAPEIE